MKLLPLFIILLYSSITSAKMLEGHFNCAVQFEERMEISIFDGEDFPSLGSMIYPTRIKNSVLKFQFKGKFAALLNPEALPNWMLINPSQYKKQISFGELYKGKPSYQIEWQKNWYFGSRVSIDINENLKAEVSLDDNDGSSSTHTCSLKKR